MTLDGSTSLRLGLDIMVITTQLQHPPPRLSPTPHQAQGLQQNEKHPGYGTQHINSGSHGVLRQDDSQEHSC